MNKVMQSLMIGTIEVTDSTIRHKTMMKDIVIQISDIEYLDCELGTLAKNGELIIKENGKLHRMMFNSKFNKDIKELVQELNIKNKEIIPSASESLKMVGSLIPHSYKITYLGGHPKLTKEGEMSINISGNEVTLGGLLNKVNLENISAARLETESEIKSRYTATRIAMLGIFALAFKKNKKITNKFLTIDCEYSGVPISVILTGDNVMKALGPITNCIANKKKLFQNELLTKKMNEEEIEESSYISEGTHTLSKADEIIKLKGLLDLGIITSDEFETEKKSILSK
ncbi:MAG: SHOCT domain-containing protein [Clostridiaceae bacterium]